MSFIKAKDLDKIKRKLEFTYKFKTDDIKPGTVIYAKAWWDEDLYIPYLYCPELVIKLHGSQDSTCIRPYSDKHDVIATLRISNWEIQKISENIVNFNKIKNIKDLINFFKDYNLEMYDC